MNELKELDGFYIFYSNNKGNYSAKKPKSSKKSLDRAFL